MTERLAFISRPKGRIRPIGLGLCIVLLSACAVGPDYQKPSAAAPVQFKAAAGWRAATPSDAMVKGAWWEVYGDPRIER
ncbi:hypothetical protein OA77_27710, partial [Pseudomonas coronafaciens]